MTRKRSAKQSSSALFGACLLLGTAVAAWASCGYGQTAQNYGGANCAWITVDPGGDGFPYQFCTSGWTDTVVGGGCDNSNNYLCTQWVTTIQYHSDYCQYLGLSCGQSTTSGTWWNGKEQDPYHCGG